MVFAFPLRSRYFSSAKFRSLSSHGSWHTQYPPSEKSSFQCRPSFLSKEISHSPTPESPVWVKWYLWMPFIYEIFHYELSIHLPSFKSIFSSIFPLWELCATRIANENIFCLLADCAALAALVANILAENFYQCNRLSLLRTYPFCHMLMELFIFLLMPALDDCGSLGR